MYIRNEQNNKIQKKLFEIANFDDVLLTNQLDTFCKKLAFKQIFVGNINKFVKLCI